MYSIKANDNFIYQPHLEELQMLSASLTKEDNVADNFTFAPSPKNELAQNLPELSTIIDVFDDGTRIFRGRILNSSQDMHNIYTYVCEGELAFFADSVVRLYSWDSGGVESYFRFLVDSHNAQVDASRRFVVRDVTVTDPNDYIVRASSQYPSTMEEIKTKLLDLLGGHLFVERVGDTTYIDYLEDSPFLSNQTITIDTNIIDLKQFIKGEDIATAIIPLGARLEGADGEDDPPRLTIEEANGGVDYVFDQDAVDKYGFIVKSMVWDDVTIDTNLLARGRQALAYAINPLKSIELQAVDMKKMGVDVDHVRFFDYVKIESPPHGIAGTLLVTKVNYDLMNPSNDTMTIGSDFGSFTKDSNNLVGRLSPIVDQAVANEITHVNNTIQNLWSAITISEFNILNQVKAEYVTQTQHNTAITTLSTSLEQTNNSFNFTFTNLNQLITQVNEESQTRFSEISRYIRFTDGNITLGEVGNPIQLVLKHDRISFLQGGAEVAYINNKQLWITDATILNQLNLGLFAYIPRSNGNLSFRKVR